MHSLLCCSHPSPDLVPTPRRVRESPHPAHQLQRALGNQAISRRMQAKGTTGQPGDRFEREADTLAASVLRDGGPVAPGDPAPVAARHEHLPGGQPLSAAVRSFFEPRLGRNLDGVRVHHDAESGRSARAAGALAFTSGSDIVFGAGKYVPGAPSGMRLIAHELAHVLQQESAGRAVQRQPATRGPTPAAGTTDQMVLFVNNPQLETDASLRAALAMLDRYRPTVAIADVEFRVMTVTPSFVGTGLFEDGRSHWEGNRPVIELTQEKYDTIARHFASGAAVSDVHDVIRTVGHEMYHLYRERTGNVGNPIQPLYQAEATRRMEQIRQNWVNWAQSPGGHRDLGIPQGQQVTRWEDIPAAQRQSIEAGASQTSVIQGLYEQTAYLVEEIYVKIEELSYLRVQQRAETGTRRPSAARVSQLANLIYRLSTALDQSVGSVDFMTPELLRQTRAAMLQYLRQRYPHRGSASLDSFEVIFYLSAIQSGLPPLYDANGVLISVAPPQARVP